MKLTEVNWGIIGCGDVTEVKSGPPLYKLDRSNLVAVMRRDGAKAEDYAKRHGVAKWYSNANELIHDPNVNAVYIATPPNTHAEYAIKAMNAGKVAYVEKPMAKNYAECLEMIKVSEETQVPLYVAYYRRALPQFLRAKELVDSGTIGKPLTVHLQLYKQAIEKEQSKKEMHWHVFPEIAGAGHFYDLASHQLDYLDFVFGPIINVSGHAKNIAGYYPAEDTVSASFEFESGVIGSGSWCFVVDHSSEKDIIEITGTHGKITMPCFAAGNLKLETSNGMLEFPNEKPEHVAGGLVKLIVEELTGGAKCPSTGFSGARTSKVMEEIVKTYYSNLKD
ncbi:Gfo/Idh/MocA family protein [Sunxiuqinia sp. A32]|uniref:Gfo/Idh/MocA family protein n=1 Tax=Sunxiuqinia sp. A32 TaxID=3461496 RepID=UPI0040461B9D